MHSPVFTPEEVAGTLRPRERATWLPQRAYTDETVYAHELTTIFGREWLGVFHHTSLPNVGDYRSMQIAGRPLLFVRDQDRRIRCYINICRHRGMAIAEGTGNCKKFICPYHTWAYDLNGRLITTPQINGEWTNGTVGLTEVRTELFVGFVFINFNKEAPTLASKLPDLAAELSAWGDADLEVMFETTYTCRWNWKLMWDNAIEAYHVMGTHRGSAEDDIPANLAYVSAPAEAQHYTVLHTPFSRNRTFKPQSAMDAIATIPNLPALLKDELRFINVWPCTGIWGRQDFLVGYFVVPGDSIDEIQVINMIAVPKAVKQLPGYPDYKAQWTSFQDLIQQEDMRPCERIARSYKACKEWIPGPYAATEAACWYFHRWYLNKMGAGSGLRGPETENQPNQQQDHGRDADGG